MKTSILLAAGAAALLTALPAVAQDVDPTPAGAPPPVASVPSAIPPAPGVVHGDWTLKDREHWLDDHINKAHDEHDIDGHEADRVHHELDRIRDDENRMRGEHDGQLTDNETAMLESRLDAMATQIHWLHQSAFERPW
jgi:hypothetical protein